MQLGSYACAYRSLYIYASFDYYRASNFTLTVSNCTRLLAYYAGDVLNIDFGDGNESREMD